MSFKNVPLKRKLVGVIFLTSLLVLFWSCVFFFYYEFQNYRQNTARHYSALADVIAANSAAPLIFDDKKAAQQLLTSLTADPEIIAAAFFDKEGKVYATYSANGTSEVFPANPENRGIHQRMDFLTLYMPISQAGSRVGTLYLKGNLDLRHHLEIYALVLVTVLIGSGLLALILSNLFQRKITEPLLTLAAVARVVSEKNDYTVRAKKTTSDEIGELTEAFNSMLNQVQNSHAEVEHARDEALHASRAKDDFLAALSHELRTPLNPVLLLASEEAADRTQPKDVREKFENIRRNIELEARLIDDLLDLTRIKHGKLVFDMRPNNVHAILMEAVETIRPDTLLKSIQIKLDFQAAQFAAMSDAVRLQQVFWNVMKNAVKFTPRDGCISVATLLKERRLVIQISDTGIGMKPEEMKHVFDAFAQGEHAEQGIHRFGGLGLGLAISRKLIESHAGTIEATSPGPGQGSTFVIELPLTSAPVEPDTSLLKRTAITASTPVAKVHRRILLVEDHEPTRATMISLLARRQYEVIGVGTVADARKEMQSQPFDLLISDIGLPDGNGFDLMASLHEQFKIRGIALTGYGMDQDIIHSQRAGFVAHLTKPIRIEKLDEALMEAFAEDEAAGRKA